jgi:transcriptional regulator with XRE-family HTH domain
MLKEMINGEQLRKLRKEAGFSQQKLAEKLGLTRETINKIENNNAASINALELGKLQDWWMVCSLNVSISSQKSFKQYILNLFA